MQKSKRLKQCFQNASQVAEIFAKQSQNHAYCKNAFFNNNLMYSYGHHYLLAAFVQFRGIDVAVVNFNKVSKTTTAQSYSTSCALEKAGHTVLPIDMSINSYTNDDDIRADIMSQLDEKAAYFCERIIESQFRPLSPWQVAGLFKDIKSHNETCLKFGLKELVVDVSDEDKIFAIKLSRLADMARADKRRRKQMSLSEAA